MIVRHRYIRIETWYNSYKYFFLIFKYFAIIIVLQILWVLQICLTFLWVRHFLTNVMGQSEENKKLRKMGNEDK